MAKEMYSCIFHGRRSLELQKWHNLFQNRSAFLNCFSSAARAADVSIRDCRKGKIFTVSYLVDSLGLTTKLAESISRKVSFEDKGNPDSVLSLLRSHGFTDSQISNIIRTYPRLLIADSEKSLGLKLQFLQSRGALSSELTEIVSSLPKILGKRGDKTLSLYYDFVKEIIEVDKSHKTSKFEKLCHSLPQGSKLENKIRNLSVLRELGVPQRLFLPLLICGSNTLHGKEKFENSLEKVVEMGFDPTTAKFVVVLRVIQGSSGKAIEEKVNVYKRLGFDVEDVWAMFKKWPTFLRLSEKKITQTFETLKKCGLIEDEILSVLKKFPQCIGTTEKKIEKSIDTFLGLGFSRDEFAMMVKRFPQSLNLSAETMKKKTEFIVKKMNWPLKAVVLFPQVLGYNMEKRIIPRCNIIKILMSKGSLGSELPSVASVLACTDQAFLNRYAVKHDDKHLVLELMPWLSSPKMLHRSEGL